jgi:hypothetical protein
MSLDLKVLGIFLRQFKFNRLVMANCVDNISMFSCLKIFLNEKKDNKNKE